MLEFSNNPAFLPSLCGFLAGFVLVALIATIRGKMARSKARDAQKTAEETIARMASERSALETQIGKLRSNEARLVKHQGQLEGLAKSEAQKERELGRLIKATRESLQTSLQAREKVILDAISSIPAPVAPEPALPKPIAPALSEDLDFVPLENLPSAPGESTAFEGFDTDQSASKAESAANAFRAALNDKHS